MAEQDRFEQFDDGTIEDVAHLVWAPSLDPASIDPGLAQTLSSEKNSPAATGARMKRFLEHLIAHPVSHLPDKAPAWTAMMASCDELSPLQTYVLRNVLGKEANIGYEPMPAEVEFEFPRDHEVKLGAQVGWHFIVGSCWDADGGEYGVEIMFFGNALYPPALAAEFGLSDIENQAIEMQFAISERGQRHHQAEPLVALGTSGLIETATTPFAFRLGRNAMESTTSDDLFPLRVSALGVDRGDETELPLGLDLLLTGGKGILLQGDDGAMPSVAGIGTYYYSIPGICVDPQASTLRIGDREVTIVRGEFWFDHQWGYISGVSQSPAVRASDYVGDPEPDGWDWFMTHFVGDRQLTMFAPHRSEFAAFYGQDGAEAPGTMTRRVAGKFMDADSSTRVAWGTLEVDRWVRADHSPRPDRYPATHVWHPDHFHFTFDDLPSDIIEFTMEPIVGGGQSAFFANGAQICEGAVVLRDPAGADIGRGFAESVLYADTVANQVRLAGLPPTDEMVALVRAKRPDDDTVARNTAYLAEHPDELVAVAAAAKGLEFFVEGLT